MFLKTWLSLSLTTILCGLPQETLPVEDPAHSLTPILGSQTFLQGVYGPQSSMAMPPAELGCTGRCRPVWAQKGFLVQHASKFNFQCSCRKYPGSRSEADAVLTPEVLGSVPDLTHTESFRVQHRSSNLEAFSFTGARCPSKVNQIEHNLAETSVLQTYSEQRPP